MPDMQICSICGKEFDFAIEGLCKKVDGDWMLACSKLCALKETVVTELIKSCLFNSSEQNTVKKEPEFNIHNLN